MRGRLAAIGSFLLGLTIWAFVCREIVASNADRGPGWLVDADCYFRLIRTNAIFGHGTYPFERFMVSNPPVGETTHWTLPLDVLLAIGGAACRPFSTSFEASLTAFGYWVSPLLFASTLAIAVRMAARYGGTLAAVCVAVLLPLDRAVTGWFIPARPDHHSLLVFLFTASAAAFVEWHDARTRRRFALVAALLVLMCWTSVEGMVALFGILGALGAEWTLTAKGATWRLPLVHLALVSAAGISLAFIVEHAGAMHDAWRWDTFSPRYAIALAVFGGVVHAIPAEARRTRALALLAGGALAAGAFILPSAFVTPGDPAEWRMLGYMGRAVSDAKPLLSFGRGAVLATIGVQGLLLPLFARSWLRRATLLPASRITVLAATVGYFVLSLRNGRFAAYGAVLLAVVAAVGLADLVERFAERLAWSEASRAPRQIVIVFAVALSFPLAGEWAASHAGDAPRGGSSAIDAEPLLARAGEAWRRDRASRHVTSDRVLSHIALGPALAYHWGALVLGTPYQRNGAGMERSFEIFESSDWTATLQRLRAEEWRYVLVVTDPDVNEVHEYRAWHPGGPPLEATFLAALTHDPPMLPDVETVFEAPVPKTQGLSLRLLYIGGE